MKTFWTNFILIVTVLAVSLPTLNAEPIAKSDFFTFGSKKHSKAKHFQYLLGSTASDKSARNDKMQAAKIALDSIVGMKQEGVSPATNYFTKMEREYNAKGLDKERREYSNEGNIGERVWKKEYRLQIKYDSKDRIIELLQYDKAEEADEWRLGYKDITTYESDTKATSLASYFDTETGEWLEMHSSEIILENGNIKEVTSRWEYGGMFETIEKEVYEYNANNDILQWTNYIYDDETEDWIQDAKEIYTYEGSRLIEYSYFYWDDMLEGEWIEEDKTTYLYEDGILVESIDLVYDDELQELAPDSKSVLTIDKSVNPADVIHGKTLFEILPIKHKINLVTEYEYENDEWVKDADYKFYYSPFNPTSVIEAQANALLLYPNPTSGAVHFADGEDLIDATIEIYDLAGRKLITQTLGGNASVSLGGLDAGMYIYKLTSAGTVKTGKIIKE